MAIYSTLIEKMDIIFYFLVYLETITLFMNKQHFITNFWSFISLLLLLSTLPSSLNDSCLTRVMVFILFSHLKYISKTSSRCILFFIT